MSPGSRHSLVTVIKSKSCRDIEPTESRQSINKAGVGTPVAGASLHLGDPEMMVFTEVTSPLSCVLYDDFVALCHPGRDPQ